MLSLWALTEPCESDSQTSGTLWFYDIICFLTNVSCSVLSCCMFEGASHFHRHFFANQSLSPSTGVVKSLSRCDTLFYTRSRGPFLSPEGSSSLGQDLRSAWERPNLARQISHSFIARATRVDLVDEGDLRRAICLILFFSVFLWMSWGGLDRDFFFGGLIPLHVQCLATFSTKDPKLIPIGESKDKGQRSKLTMNFYKWQNATEVRENSMDILMQQSAWKRGTCSKMKRAKGKETLGIKLKSSGTRKKHKV